MESIVIIVFVVGYLAIALEHPIQINKTATALLTGILCWTIYALLGNDTHAIKVHLSEHLSEISEILFFLMGAMTIVELVDAYQGFKIITDRIKTKDPRKLMWGLCALTFFLSAILDNLTTTIVMVSLVRKLIPAKQMRLFFVGMIVVSANAGGAWSPIGDVTTTMLWIGDKITAANIIVTLIIPSIFCMVVPLLYIQFTMKGTLKDHAKPDKPEHKEPVKGGGLMLFAGVMGLVSVPVFKTVTHLPPYMGMLLALSVVWIISEFINPKIDDEVLRKKYTAVGALTRIDVPSVLFFLGILLAVSALQSMGTLLNFALFLESTIGDNRVIITLVGILSSIVDNVPLVAASMGMYDPNTYPTDHMIWEYLAYCAGTGGSMLIIGSAAGVAAMGMEKIDFIWYLKKISLLALMGYFAGVIAYLLTYPFFIVNN